MSKADFEKGLIIGMQLSGDKSESKRQAIINDLAIIGVTLNPNTTWDVIDATIQQLYVSGVASRLSDTYYITNISAVDALNVYFDTMANTSQTDIMPITTLIDTGTYDTVNVVLA